MNLELDELYCHPGLFIARSDTHGWGVFTSEDIEMYDVLQESLLIVHFHIRSYINILIF